MKKFFLLKSVSMALLMALLCTPLTVNAQGSKANFSGSWAFNASKSDMGQPPQGMGGGGQRPGGFGGGDMVVKQDASMLVMERTMQGMDGQAMTTTTKYSLDGKETVNTTGRGESKSVAKWSADGKTLDVVTTMSLNFNGQTNEMKTSEAWSLNAEGNLSVVSIMNTPNGERKVTRVYDKK